MACTYLCDVLADQLPKIETCGTGAYAIVRTTANACDAVGLQTGQV